MPLNNELTRREFVSSTSKAALGTLLLSSFPLPVLGSPNGPKRRLAMVGTGHRGSGMWGKDVVANHSDLVEFVGLCDKNPGRLLTARTMMNVPNCPTFADFDEMMTKTTPDTLIVTTVDGTHHEFISKALAMGCDVITEKPMTTSPEKLRMILEAQKRSKNAIIVAHNYRYSPTRARIKELLLQERIGKLVSVDFHWYLDVYHGSDYFRRWHRLTEHGGTLLNHKASHHFDLLNWWIASDPVTVHAFGALEFYGRNNSFRHTNCRPCPHKEKCQFYFDMTKDKRLMALYADNEAFDGYMRDGCVWKEDIDIFDKMAVQIKYANNVSVSYSLTTYSPYEGYRIAFNGTKGRLDFWMHERQPWPMEEVDELQITGNFGKAEFERIKHAAGGHYGGDPLMKDKIFRNPSGIDPLKQAASVRDGAMSVLVGFAARQSIATGKAVDIKDVVGEV